MKTKKPVIAAASLFLVVISMALVVNSRRAPIVGDLPDGTGFKLALATHTNIYNYSRRYLPEWVRPFAPLIRDKLEQAIFIQPPDEDSEELHLKIAFTKLIEFEFLARPEFVEQVRFKTLD